MSLEPTVSIVTPSFNQGAFLESTIRSVLAQTYPKIEHVIMDGGSTDDSRAVLTCYSSRIAHWQSAPDQGFGHAIADGFGRASGEILAYLNSDDLLAPTAVANAVYFLDQHPHVIMVYGNRICIDARGRLLYIRPSLPVGAQTRFSYIILGQESCFWRRDAYHQVGGINKNLRFAIDYDLFSRFARIGRIAHCGSIWGYFRRHQQSKTSTSFSTLGRAEVAQIQRDQWETEPSFIDSCVRLANRSYAVAYGGILELGALQRDVPLPARAPIREQVARLVSPDHWLARALRRPRVFC